MEALSVEYETIVEHGLILQIDAPDLAEERHVTYASRPLKDFREYVELIIAGINRALETIPRGRVRRHVCWGNYARGRMIATWGLRIFCRSCWRRAKRC